MTRKCAQIGLKRREKPIPLEVFPPILGCIKETLCCVVNDDPQEHEKASGKQSVADKAR